MQNREHMERKIMALIDEIQENAVAVINADTLSEFIGKTDDVRVLNCIINEAKARKNTLIQSEFKRLLPEVQGVYAHLTEKLTHEVAMKVLREAFDDDALFENP